MCAVMYSAKSLVAVIYMYILLSLDAPSREGASFYYVSIDYFSCIIILGTF